MNSSNKFSDVVFMYSNYVWCICPLFNT